MKKITMLPLTVLLIWAACLEADVSAQVCGFEGSDQCCWGIGKCPSGYYEDSSCRVISPSTAAIVETTTDDPVIVTGADDDVNDVTDDVTSAMPINGVTNSVTDNVTDVLTNDTTTDSITTTVSVETASPARVYLCRPCVDNCMTCESNDTCKACDTGFEETDGQCVKRTSNDEFPIGAVAGGATAGVVVIIIVVIVAFCCYKRRSKSDTSTIDDRVRTLDVERQRKSDDESNSSSSPPTSPHSTRDHTYQNIGFKPDDLTTKIPQSQDRIFRYTKDPTVPNTDIKPATVNPAFDDESEALYANSTSILKHELDTLPQAPLPPTQSTKKTKKKRKSTFKEPPKNAVEEEDIYEGENEEIGNGENEDIYEGENEEIYENEGTIDRSDNGQAMTHSGEEEVYCNDPAEDHNEENPYMNYTPGTSS